MFGNKTKKNILGFLSGLLAPPLLKGLALTQRYSVLNESALTKMDEHGDNFILAFWHGQMLPTLFYFARSDFDQSSFYTFISPHRDGEYITRAAEGLGINALRTSLRDRRLSALKQAYSIVEEGYNLAITPDGPIGPRLQAKSGPLKLSERFEMDILPVAALSTRARYFSSWDRFALPLPPGTIEVEFGNPLEYEDEKSIEKRTKALETSLNKLTRSVSERVGSTEHIRTD